MGIQSEIDVLKLMPHDVSVVLNLASWVVIQLWLDFGVPSFDAFCIKHKLVNCIRCLQVTIRRGAYCQRAPPSSYIEGTLYKCS